MDRILESPAFAGSPQLRAFLGYVVDQRLKGNESRIKGYTIAVEALGRATSFDPAADPIIRVEAARLRRLIGDYYAGPGADDPVLIDVPKGGYVPVFRAREPSTAPPPEPAAEPSRRPLMLAGLGAAAAAAVLAFVLLPYFIGPGEAPGTAAPDTAPSTASDTPPSPPDPSAASPLQASPAAPAASDIAKAAKSSHPPFFKGDLPRIYVANIALDGDPPQPAAFSPAKVHDNLAAALRLFSEVELSETAGAADYRVEGRASFTGDKVFLSFILVYAPEQEIVWSALFDLTYDRNAADLAEDRIVRNIAGAIARPYGVIFNHAASHRDDASQVSEGFRCVLLTFHSQRRFAPDINAQGRDCLTSLAGRQADFAPARALLPMLYVDNARFGAKSDQEREASLAQAFVLAKHAVAATPDSARAYQALQSVLLFMGRGDEALDAGQRARELNPYDTDIMATHASTLIMLGDAAKGLALMQQARRLSPGHPAWYDTMIVFAAYGTGDTDLARREAALIEHDDTLSGLLARILIAHADRDEARRVALAKKLVGQRPEFGTEPEATLHRIFPASPLSSQLLTALTASGVAAVK